MENAKIITLTKENLAKEHICCCMSSKTTEVGVTAKKEWLSSRMEEGLKFKKLDARGKVFIEYIPAENAWVPVDAPGYVVINCFWVSGSFKGHGYGKQLLAECESDVKANGYKGIVAMVSNKKKPFLTDKAFLVKQGYEICDRCPPYFELAAKRFSDDAPLPQFKKSAGEGLGEGIKGIDIFYTAQCPFNVPYIKMLVSVILESDIPVRTHHITTKEEAQSHVCPVTTYSVFIDGKYHTNEIMTTDKLKKNLSNL